MKYSTYVEQQLQDTYENRACFIEEDKKKSLGRYSIDTHSQIKSYDKSKEYFERFWGYTKGSKSFFCVDDNGFSKYSLNEMLTEVDTDIECVDSKNNKVNFIKKYVKDSTRKQYTNIDFKPDGHVDSDRKNVAFPLPHLQQLPDQPMYTNMVLLFRQLISCIANDRDNEKGYVQYIVEVLSKALTRPLENKGSNVLLAFLGRKGTGKSTLIETLKWMYDSHIQTITSASNIIGNENASLFGKRIVNLDEVCLTDAEWEQMKSLITDDIFMMKALYQNRTPMANVSTFIVTANHHFVRSDDIAKHGARRLAVFRSNDSEDNKAFLKNYYSFVGKNSPLHKTYVACIRHYLQTMTVLNDDFQSRIPRTHGLLMLLSQKQHRIVELLEHAVKEQYIYQYASYFELNAASKQKYEDIDLDEYDKTDIYSDHRLYDKALLIPQIDEDGNNTLKELYLHFNEQMEGQISRSKLNAKKLEADAIEMGLQKRRFKNKNYYSLNPRLKLKEFYERKQITEFEGKSAGDETMNEVISGMKAPKISENMSDVAAMMEQELTRLGTKLTKH